MSLPCPRSWMLLPHAVAAETLFKTFRWGFSSAEFMSSS
jgi:hypothetical protein